MPLLSSTHPSDNRTARNPKLAPGTSRRPPPPGWTVQATTSLYKRPSRQERTQGPAYPCLLTCLPTDGRRGAEHVACQRPSTQRCTQARERTCMPADGLYHHHTMSKEQDPCRPAARGIEPMPQPGLRGRGFPFGTAGPGPKPRGHAPKDASLVGLGRLERPTSRLSGVRSNQLSYRPESHPKDRTRRPHPHGRKASRSRQDCLAATPAGAIMVVRRDVQTAVGL